jgi:hypothetical protein
MAAIMSAHEPYVPPVPDSRSMLIGRLRKEIEEGRYRIDAALVADAIVGSEPARLSEVVEAGRWIELAIRSLQADPLAFEH